MSYSPVRFFLKLPLLILVPYLFCIPVFSQDGILISNLGVNPSVLPRPDKLPSQLNLEDEPEWRYQRQVNNVGGKVTTPRLLQVLSSMDGDLPPISGSPDMNNLLAELLKKLTQEHDRKMNPPFEETESDLTPKQPALLIFDAANEGRQIVPTIGEQGHLNVTEQVDEKTEIKAITEWEDLGVVWRDNKNNFYTTSAERTIESFDNDFSVLAYLNAFGVRTLYYRTQADGTRVYVYKALDGKVYEVTVEDIKRSQQRTYEYEMAKISGEGLAAGGRVNYDGEWVRIRPARPDKSETRKGILDQEIEVRQAPKGPTENKRDRDHPYLDARSRGHGAEKNAANVQRREECGLERTPQSSDAAGSEHPQQEVIKETGSPTPNYGYEDKGKLTIKGGISGLKVAPDGSFAAGIKKGKVVICVPAQSDNEEGEIISLDIKAISLSLSKDGLCMVTEDGREDVKLWNRGEEVSQWALSDALDTSDVTEKERVDAINEGMMEDTSEMVKAMKFSPGGGYHIVTRDRDNVALLSLKGEESLCLYPVQQFTVDEQDRLMVIVRNKLYSRKIVVWRLPPNTRLLFQQEKLFDGDIQRMHLSPDAKMIVISSEDTLWIGKINNNGSIDIVEHRSIEQYGRMSDVYLDNNSAITIQYLKGSVTLTRIKTAEDQCDTTVTNLALAANDDRTVKNAFYIPDGDRVAVIFSDDSMSMWQNSVGEGGYQKQFDDPDFGELLYYNGAENFFLVIDSNRRVIFRQWSKQ